MKKANDVTDEVTQQEYSNNKCYVLAFRYIYIYIYIDLLFSYNIKIKVDKYVKLNHLKWICKAKTA